MPDTDLTSVRRAAKRRRDATEGFRQAVLEAHRAGKSLREIGEAAGLSHVAVLKIVRGAEGA